MTRFMLFALTAVLLCFNSGCSTLSVQTDYNPDYNFSELKTYAWLDNSMSSDTDVRLSNDLLAERVRKAVEQVLTARGYVKTEAGSADCIVSWLGAIDKKLQIDSIDHFYSPYGYGSLYRDPVYGGARRTTTAREYEVGTIIIDILDPAQHTLIWRGTGSDRITGNKKPKEAAKGINEAVAAIMQDFPPVK